MIDLGNSPLPEADLERHLGPATKKVLQILLDCKIVNEESRLDLIQDAWMHRRGLQDSAVALGHISQSEFMRVSAEEWKLPLIDLSKISLPQSIMLVAETFALEHLVVPFGKRDSFVEFAITAPVESVTEHIVLLTGLRAKCFLAMPSDIIRAIDALYNSPLAVGTRRPEIVVGKRPLQIIEC